MKLKGLKKSLKKLTLKKIVKKNRIDEAIALLKEEKLKKLHLRLNHVALQDLTSIEQINACINILKNHKQHMKNEIYTPFSALQKLNSYIPKGKIIWEPFTKGNHKFIESPKYLRQLGHQVVATGEDFFYCNHGEVIVSNIPFSSDDGNIKKNILQRLFYLKKPFSDSQ